jgi:hypothetical protein
MSEFP